MKYLRRAAILLVLFSSLSFGRIVPCPPVSGLPPVTGCDGLVLTDASAIEAQSAGIIRIADGGIGGSDSVIVNDGESIDIVDSGCYQLGKDGRAFALTFWLRATGSTQIIGTKSQYNSGQGFIVRVSTSSQEAGEAVVKITSSEGSDNDTVESVPFKLNEWTHVAVNYANGRMGATFEVNVNLASSSEGCSADVYNSKLRIGDEGWGSINSFDVCVFQCWGRVLSRGEIKGLFFDKASYLNLSSANLSAVMSQLRDHISGASPLTGPEIEGLTAVFVENSIFLDANVEVMTEAFDLVSYYEAHEGPLFINSRTSGGFEREQEGDDGFELDRAIFTIQQAIHDRIFSAENCQSCQSLLNGKEFETANFFPGRVPISRPPTGVFDVSINATVPEFWGKPVAFATSPARRPTGCYLVPGIMGEVTVPASMVNQGFSILAGAHTWDKSRKSKIKRFDRVTKTFPITSETTSIANPFGGGIYINVPYKSNLGPVTVQIGKAVRSPFFSATSHRQTTLQEWTDIERHLPGPWADFESDKFMMQVPTSWIYNYADPVTLMEEWDLAMDGVSEMLGFPLVRNRTVLYVQPDITIAHGAYGIGYPQVNQLYNPHSSTDGDSSHFFLTNPIGWSTTYHELGHAQLFSKFPGHTEATVNLPYVYVATEKFGMGLVEAFTKSMRLGHLENMSVDQAALTWMVTENFRNGRPMDITNSTKNEVRYQHRGYGRYVDMAVLFGWHVVSDFYYQEHLDYMSGAPGDGLGSVDSRILRLSKAAGVDLTPLIHCWGVHPVDLGALRAAILAEGLPRSKVVYDRLVHYKEIIPANNAEFWDHYLTVYPSQPGGGNPDYQYGWYNVWKSVYDESHGTAAKNAMQDIIDLHFGADREPP
ncbi:MAG: M60 family metallopeptidase, partial [Planctomycetota bacterium]